ncbi:MULTISPECIES: transposase domain-containing protein [Acinetobacter]|nr:transposase domain-containing protein [Acinetobacter variabilis]
MELKNRHGVQRTLTAYLSDVLKRLPTHKVTQIEELLPHCWKPKLN